MIKTATKKIAFVLLSLVAAFAVCFGVAGLNKTTYNAHAESETAYENTYLTGFRSNNAGVMHFYWRIDGTSLGYSANQVLAKISVDYTSNGETAKKTVQLQYTTASTQGINGAVGATSDRKKGAFTGGAAHPCIYINISPAAVAGDTFTIPAGTVLDNKYVLTQDYTVTFNGKNWLFTDESAIPVELTGFRSGAYDSGKNIYNMYLYGGKVLDDYYVKDVSLNAAMPVEYIPADGEKSTINVTLKPETVSCINNGNVKTSALLLQYNGNFNAGDVLTIRKGTKFDNWATARDCKLTRTANDWICELAAEDADPAISLSLRGNGGADYINLFCGTTMKFDYVADEQLNKNAVVYKNGAPFLVALNPLAMSGANRSFAIRSAAKVANGDVVKIPAGFVVAGYKTDKDYMFRWDGSKWSAVSCDGVNHRYADEYTCHDRTCSCGHVEPASTEHTFAEGTVVCDDRVCTVCHDTVKGKGHTWVGETCEKTCSVCGAKDGVHEWDTNNGEVTTPATCTTEGVMTYKCTKCTATMTEPIAKVAHTIAEGAKTCSVCGYRIPYTADDISEILTGNKLKKYTYSDFHENYEMSEMGHIYNEYTDGIKYGNTYLLNTVRLGEKSYRYEEGHENYADMTVGFSLNVSAWAANGRSGYVYLAAHENGSWGIGFMFTLVNGNPNLRFVYRSGDGGNQRSEFVAPQTIDMQLNKAYYFELGVIKNDDGSIFAFALKDGELLMSGTLTASVLESMKCEENHDGIGGAASIVFNGSAAVPSVAAVICDKDHKYPAEMHACLDYKCEICGTVKEHTADHVWGEKTLKQAGTCTVPDTWAETCKECRKETEYQGDLRHEWDEEHPIIVTKRSCGGVDEVVKYVCKLCGAESGEKTLENTGIAGKHEYVYKTIKEATCTEKGLEEGVCSKCGNEKPRSETPIDENNHKHVTAVSGKAATCTEKGEKDHFVCSDCNKKLVKEGDAYVPVTDEELIIDATGHDFEKGVCKNCKAEDPDYVAPAENGGCASGVSSVAILLPLLAAAFVILGKKQRIGKQ